MSNDPFSTVIPFQVPEQVRAFAETSVNQAREGYNKFKAVAESNNEAMEAAYTSASKGASDFTAKLVDIAKANTASTFDFAYALMGAKTLPEAFEMFNSHAHRQLETLSAQSKELAEIGQKLASDAVQPLKAGASKVFHNVA
ncbi:MAG: phasin family protein [Xanthobacteraceae bacterium]|nr:phasin family protein [Xanthobacteraceae bacterium]